MPQSLKPSDFPKTVQEIRQIEAHALGQGLPLMLRAGEVAANFVMQHAPANGSILVLVGPGNNGGDALVAARILHDLGKSVRVVMPVKNNTLPTDAQKAMQNWLAAGEPVQRMIRSDKPDFVIDGLFGIGLSRTLSEPYQEMIDLVNEWQVQTLALDIPSGVQADTGLTLGRPIRATWTICFIAPTMATRVEESAKLMGKIYISHLGIECE